METPNLDFATFAYAAALKPNTDETDLWSYSGGSQPLQNLAFAIAASGTNEKPNSYPDSPTKAANATWELNHLYSPTLSCSHITGDKRNAIWKNIWNSYNWTEPASAPVFLSWVPWSDLDANGSGFSVHAGETNAQDRDLPYFINATYITGPSKSSVSTDGPISFFAAVMPNTYNLSISRDPFTGLIGVTPEAPARPDFTPVFVGGSCPFKPMVDFNSPLTLECNSSDYNYHPAAVFEEATLIRCDMFNASKRIAFDYRDRIAPMRLVEVNATYDDPPVNGSLFFTGPYEGVVYENSTELASHNYCVPFMIDPLPTIRPFDHAPDAHQRTCIFDSQSLRVLSYQSMMAAFHQTFTGYISKDDIESRIVDTVFMETDELNWLRKATADGGFNDVYDISNIYAMMPQAANYTGTAARPISADQGSLAMALVMAFERLILSQFAEPYFQ